MNKIHYFQRYSQKENVVTNNTLLLFSRLYNDSPSRFEDIINSLLTNPTDFKKITKYPIQRTKFFDLGSELGLEELPNCVEIAELLQEKTWE